MASPNLVLGKNFLPRHILRYSIFIDINSRRRDVAIGATPSVNFVSEGDGLNL